MHQPQPPFTLCSSSPLSAFGPPTPHHVHFAHQHYLPGSPVGGGQAFANMNDLLAYLMENYDGCASLVPLALLVAWNEVCVLYFTASPLCNEAQWVEPHLMC